MNKRFSQKITNEQKQEIINSYTTGQETRQQLANRYGVQVDTIKRFFKEMDIPTSTKISDKLSEDIKIRMIELYEIEGWTLKEIGVEYNFDSRTIKNILVDSGIEIRSGVYISKYKIDKTFFKKINTEEKAYWLGFLYADGCTCRLKEKIRGFNCTLSIVDLSHLEKLKKSLQSTHEIRTGRNNNSTYCVLYISSEEMGIDLINLGCVSAKSKILTYPNIDQIPVELQYHFIRGYFDGDGSIVYSNERKNYKCIEILGTEDFLTGMGNFLDIKSAKINYINNKNIFHYKISSRSGLFEFYNKVYKNTTIYLDRKYDRFQHFLKINNKL